MPFVVHERKEDGRTPNSYNCPIVTGYSEVIRSAIDPEGRHGVPLDAPTFSFKDLKLMKKSLRGLPAFHPARGGRAHDRPRFRPGHGGAAGIRPHHDPAVQGRAGTRLPARPPGGVARRATLPQRPAHTAQDSRHGGRFRCGRDYRGRGARCRARHRAGAEHHAMGLHQPHTQKRLCGRRARPGGCITWK